MNTNTTSLKVGVGATVVLGLICVPVAVLAAGSDDGAGPRATTSAAAAATTAIPAGLDLTAGMPENESGEPVAATPAGEGVAGMRFCGTRALPDAGVLDRLAANASGPEYTSARELRRYGSPAEAEAALDGVVDVVELCPTEDYSTTTWHHQLVDATLGDRSVSVTRSYSDSGQPVLGGTAWHVVRVDNALLVASDSGEHSHESLAEAVAGDAERLRPLVDELRGS